MKYLRKYNESDESDERYDGKIYTSPHLIWLENSNEIVATIEDICVELKDVGFSIVFRGVPNVKNNELRLLITMMDSHDRQVLGGDIYFGYKEVEETVNRIKDYLGEKFIWQDVRISPKFTASGWVNFNSTGRNRVRVENNLSRICGVKITLKV